MGFQKFFAAAIFATALCGTPVLAQDAVTEQVRFPSGSSGTVINNTIRGYESIDYMLGAGAGQRMVVDLETSNLSNYYNIWAPGADSALFVGASDGDHFDGILPVSGDYRIQVFLMRNAARRDETATYALSIHIGGAMTPPPPDFADGDAGGPDFWEVTANRLNIRSNASTSGAVVGRADHGQVLRNLGCRGSGNDRWCNVETPNGMVSGWVAGRFLVESGGPDTASTPPIVTESAAMGPDFWEVTRVAAGDYLNLRTGPGTSNTIVARAPNGTILRNLGCRGSGDTRWCHVQTPDGAHDGWVSGAYLVESGGPGAASTPNRPGVTIPSGSPIAPDLHVRPTGEIEAAWTSGCTVLFNPARVQIQAGSSCTDAQLIASKLWVDQM